MIETDALVIGAGPVGLFQVFQLGLLGLKAHIVDVLPQAGGQCTALYPDKPIYDIPGVPVCTGRELTRQLLAQARPFMPSQTDGGPPTNLHLGQLVSHLTPQPDGTFVVSSQQGLQWHARAIFVAAGAGAFMPRTLNVAGLDQAANVHYFLSPDMGLVEPTGSSAPWRDQDLVVAGGGDEALSAALTLLEEAPATQRPAQLRLLHRRDQFQADDALIARVRAHQDAGRLSLIVGMPTGASVQEGRLTTLHLIGPDSQPFDIALDHLLVRQGMSPKLGPLTTWGMALERKQVSVSTTSFESSVARLYAVGDINAYPGKKRLLLCGFHEATIAAHHAAATLQPDAPQHLLYTTTSPLLHERLGVV